MVVFHLFLLYPIFMANTITNRLNLFWWKLSTPAELLGSKEFFRVDGTFDAVRAFVQVELLIHLSLQRIEKL